MELGENVAEFRKFGDGLSHHEGWGVIVAWLQRDCDELASEVIHQGARFMKATVDTDGFDFFGRRKFEMLDIES